jgi:predicted metal-dependent peptidase
MSNVQDKVQTAKARLAMYAGFWLALASKLEWIPDASVEIAGTNGRWVKYNRDHMNARPMGEVVFIVLHEIGHNMLAHMTRLNGRHPMLANIAMDYALDELLIKIAAETPALGIVVPGDAHHDPDPTNAGTTWEHRYNKMLKKCKKDGKGKPDTSGMKLFDEVQQPTHGDGDKEGQPLTTEESEALSKSWQMAVQTAAVMAKQRGKLPGYLEEFIGELITPKVAWRTHLAHAVTRIARDESSYRRFNRRHVSRGHYLPGMYSERIGALGYFVDTSGSIQSEEFRAAKGAMTELLEDLKPELIYFGQCDTRLHSVMELAPQDLPLPELKVQGRGGTDMREAFEWACKHEHEIDAFILQTDMYIPPLDPSLIPNVPVIWIVTTDAPVPAGCDFGTLVRVVL